LRELGKGCSWKRKREGKRACASWVGDMLQVYVDKRGDGMKRYAVELVGAQEIPI